MATIDMAAARADKAALKTQAVETLRDWIRAKAAAAGVGNTVHWGVLKFVVSKASTPVLYSGVYEDYPITSSFPTDINTEITPIVLSADTTNLSTTLVLADTSSLAVDMGVSGAGIPAGSIIESIDSATDITISQAATATATGVSLTFTGVWTAVNGANVQETLRRDGFDRGTRVDIAIVGEGGEVTHTIFVVDQDQLERDIVDTNSPELSRIMRKKILYAKVKDILSYASAPDNFPGFVF